MHKRGLCCRPVSVRLSVLLVDCIQMAEDTVDGSPIILDFLTQSTGTQFQGEPFNRGRKIHGMENFAIFD